MVMGYLDVCAGVRSAKLLTAFHLGASHVVSGLIRKMKEQRCKLHPSNAQGFVTFFIRCCKICAWPFFVVVA